MIGVFWRVEILIPVTFLGGSVEVGILLGIQNNLKGKSPGNKFDVIPAT